LSATLTFQVEPWPAIKEEIKPLLVKHWEEIALDRDAIPLDPDYEVYDKLHEMGVLVACTVRDGRKLVGYYANLLKGHPHYKSTLFAFLDVYFLLKEYRNAQNGLRLFTFMEKEMRARGVRKICSMTKLDHDASALFLRLGWKPVETIFTKLLEP
jgi:GNAT superfamily N-acetyltransferase